MAPHSTPNKYNYSGYAYESYDVIYNIICFDDVKLDNNVLQRIIDSTIGTLSAKNQTIQAKISAIKLMQFLYSKYNENAVWNQIKPQLIENMPLYATGYEAGFLEKTSANVLSFAYDLLICNFSENRINAMLRTIFLADQSDSYNLIQLLMIITDYLKNAYAQPPRSDMLSAFLFFCMTMSQHRERDVKYNATKCLIELTHYKLTKSLALMRLSHIMDKGSQSSKVAIITRIRRISSDDDSFVKQIINKGKADSKYLVRFVSERENKNLIIS